MATAERRDPYRNFNFQLESDGVPLGAFSEASGLTAEGDAVDYREGTDAQSNVRKLPGLRKYTNLTLKRGIFAADRFRNVSVFATRKQRQAQHEDAARNRSHRFISGRRCNRRTQTRCPWLATTAQCAARRAAVLNAAGR